MTKKQTILFLATKDCCCMVPKNAAYFFVMGKSPVVSEMPNTRSL